MNLKNGYKNQNLKDQNRLTVMMKGLEKGSIQTKETLKWLLNRY